MSDSVISVQKVTKAYRIWNNPAARLTAPFWDTAAKFFPADSGASRSLQARSASSYRDFHALREVSFEVRRGESWGIIGQNGSGKSTLLQIIAGTLQPTHGRIETRGRVAALLELGAGFNPEFTGRENVYLNGSILGFSRAQVDERIGAIGDFAEIGEFMDQPVRTYSSGMVVRLAFAVAAHVDPEILIVDEALSVGDARFQLKCARAIDRFIAKGVTLLFVSHDASMVKRLCRQAILLDHGNVIYSGRPNDVVNLYSKLTAEGNRASSLQADIEALHAGNNQEPEAVSTVAGSSEPSRSGDSAALPLSAAILERKAAALLTDERAHVQLSGREFAYGGESGQIATLAVLDGEGKARVVFATGERVLMRMTATASYDCPDPIFALTIKNTAGVEIYGTNTLFSGQPAPAMKAGETHEIEFIFNINLMPGHYFLSLGFTHFVGDKLVVLHRRYDAIKLEVHAIDRTFGIANLGAVITSRARN